MDKMVVESGFGFMALASLSGSGMFGLCLVAENMVGLAAATNHHN